MRKLLTINDGTWRLMRGCLLVCTGWMIGFSVLGGWTFLLVSQIGPRLPPHGIISQCLPRVKEPLLRSFTADVYPSLFHDRRWPRDSGQFWPNLPPCSTGFIGDADTYGLGIRIGIYLQWISCFIANQTLANVRERLAQAYLTFNVAIVTTILVMSARQTCYFTLEMILMYYFYFGGTFCVNVRPNLLDTGSEVK